jgi:hypothetical protein
MRRFANRILVVAVSFVGLGLAQAGTYFVLVSDMSQLQWQIDLTCTVYLRNLNQFDSTVLGCCYNFSLDTTTNPGSPCGRQCWPNSDGSTHVDWAKQRKCGSGCSELRGKLVGIAWARGK